MEDTIKQDKTSKLEIVTCVSLKVNQEYYSIVSSLFYSLIFDPLMFF